MDFRYGSRAMLRMSRELLSTSSFKNLAMASSRILLLCILPKPLISVNLFPKKNGSWFITRYSAEVAQDQSANSVIS